MGMNESKHPSGAGDNAGHADTTGPPVSVVGQRWHNQWWSSGACARSIARAKGPVWDQTILGDFFVMAPGVKLYRLAGVRIKARSRH